ncbi:hypothetical protein BN2476_990045 [Paraburkholderia piptadeniae]|uniref:Uncharacterized protein n=1 Tax=Paraburkholderia piptadeniae TaxID=1701573 RepID=A0A1N7SUI7_9BURK|nr:hypothetical protein BN2476_990045 [Paraburkholderia piptadeniae]
MFGDRECVEAVVVDGAQRATLRRVDAELLTRMPPGRHRNLLYESSICAGGGWNGRLSQAGLFVKLVILIKQFTRETI